VRARRGRVRAAEQRAGAAARAPASRRSGCRSARAPGGRARRARAAHRLRRARARRLRCRPHVPPSDVRPFEIPVRLGEACARRRPCSIWRCSKTGAAAVLADALRDGADKVRRRAAATLGELLFYIAMQPPARRPAPALTAPPRAPRRMLSVIQAAPWSLTIAGWRAACAPCLCTSSECALACAPAPRMPVPHQNRLPGGLAGSGLACAPGPCRYFQGCRAGSRRPCAAAQEAAAAWEVGPDTLAAMAHALQAGEDEAVQVLTP